MSGNTLGPLGVKYDNSYPNDFMLEFLGILHYGFLNFIKTTFLRKNQSIF